MVAVLVGVWRLLLVHQNTTFLMLIPEWFVILIFVIATIVLLVYGYYRARLKLPVTWAWLSASCMQTAWTYVHFIDNQIPLPDRALLGRLSFTSLGVSIITVATIALIYNVRQYRR